MIEGTQALLEKQRSIKDQIKTWMQDRQLPSGPGNLVLPNEVETVSPQKGNKRKKRSSKSQTKEATQFPYDLELKDEPIKIVPNSLADKIEEDWMQKLWDEIQEANARKKEQGSQGSKLSALRGEEWERQKRETRLG